MKVRVPLLCCLVRCFPEPRATAKHGVSPCRESTIARFERLPKCKTYSTCFDSQQRNRQATSVAGRAPCITPRARRVERFVPMLPSTPTNASSVGPRETNWTCGQTPMGSAYMQRPLTFASASGLTFPGSGAGSGSLASQYGRGQRRGTRTERYAASFLRYQDWKFDGGDMLEEYLAESRMG